MLRKLFRLLLPEWGVTLCKNIIGCVKLARHRNLADGRFPLRLKDVFYIMGDASAGTVIDSHYLYHSSWAARIVAENKPEKHVDVSSSAVFSSMLSAFVPVDFYEFQPSGITLSGLRSLRGDLMALPFEKTIPFRPFPACMSSNTSGWDGMVIRWILRAM